MAHDSMITKSLAPTSFMKSLPDGAQQSRDDDRTLISKTSPTVWQYEMFRIEWTRRSILRALYEMMREDTRLKRANHVFASTAVRRGFDIRITSEVSQKESQKAQDVINDFVRRVQFNAKLTQWARVLLRDGDLFLNPFVDPATRLVTQIKSLPAISIQRNSDITGNFPDLHSAFQQIDPISLQPLLELELWQVNHIRWDHEEGERYGRSQYLATLRTWKMLNMAEQDLVVRRRTRAAPKRLHNIGTKERPGAQKDIDDYMERNKLTGSQRDIVSDYFGNGQIDVKDLNADAQLDHIKDVEHIQEVHMLGTGVPLAIMGFGQNINRDILEDQMAQFKEDVEELRRLLEYGDGAAYSGIRSLFDFQLALQGIDPSILDYNIIWFEHNNETANDRVSRVVAMRGAPNGPLVSLKTGIGLLGKDIGLDTDDAIDEELRRIAGEQAIDSRKMQASVASPESVQPATDATEFEGVMPSLQNVDMRATGNNLSYPVRSDPHLVRIEQQIRTQIKSLFGTMAQSYIAKNRKRMARLADLQPSSTTGILDSYTLTLDGYTEMLMGHEDSGHCSHCATGDAKKGIEVNPAIYPLLADLVQNQDLLAQLKAALNSAYAQTNHTVQKSAKQANGMVNHSVLAGLALAGLMHFKRDDHGNIKPSGNSTHSVVYKPSQHPQKPLTVKQRTPTPMIEPLNVPAQVVITPQDLKALEKIVQIHQIDLSELLAREADQHAKEIIDTTQKLLAKALMEAMERGDPVEEWVRKALSVLDIPDWRVEMIARTEVSNAFNQALMAYYRASGVEHVQWVTHLDDRTCATCRSRNGVVYAMGDLPAIPAHPRCRCYIKPADAVEGS